MPARFPSFEDTTLQEVFNSAPLGFIDIGARGGIHETVEALAPYVSVLGFEPDPIECARMLEGMATEGADFASVDLEPIGLGSENGHAILHRISVATNDSLRVPNPDTVKRYNMVKWGKIGELEVPVSTLDTVVFERQKDNPHVGEFIKIDTQGTEHEILKGGERTLRERTLALVCEVSFAELYAGQSLFSELEMYLRSLGFTFYGFELFRLRSLGKLDPTESWSRERAIQADAIFFKDPLPGTPGSHIKLSPRQISCLFVAAVLLEYFEFALELINDCFPKEDRAQLAAFVKEASELNIDGEISEVASLADQVRKTPEAAAIHIGAFVDKRRKRGDMAKVLSMIS